MSYQLMPCVSYLLQKKYVCLEKEELMLSRLCLEYLSMPCFNTGLAKQPIEDFILKGHYAFAEYAIVYWSEHLLSAINGGSLDEPELRSLEKSVQVFLNNHFSTTKPSPRTTESA